MTGTIRVVVVDDHPLYRDGVVRTLRDHEDIDVIGEGRSSDDAVRLCAEHAPDVVLLDVSMPGGGHTALEGVRAQAPATRAIMLTVSESDNDVITALEGGASGYVLKGVEGSELGRIIRTVADGGTYVAPTLAATLLVSMKTTMSGRSQVAGMPALSKREEGILQLVSQGRSNKEIGRTLALQEKTVKHYMTGILNKLNARNRVEAAIMARDRLGLKGDL